MKQYISFFLLLTAAFACEEAVDWPLQPGENGLLVAGAILTDEFRTQEVRLSLSFDDRGGQAVPATGAMVLVSEGQRSYAFSEDGNAPGIYRSDEPFAAQLNALYQLDIQWEGKTYTAQNRMLAVRPLEPILFESVGMDSLKIKEIAPIYDSDQQAMYEVDVDWTHLISGDSNRVKLFYYTLSTVDISQLIRPPKEEIIFPKGSNVIIRKFSLNDDFAAYIRALLMETEWQGGIYDESSSSLPTNLSNGALGFFGVSALLTDTLVAE